jgi:hypothetical protein
LNPAGGFPLLSLLQPTARKTAIARPTRDTPTRRREMFVTIKSLLCSDQ